MSHRPRLAGLSPEEKRALLVGLLKSKVAGATAVSSSDIAVSDLESETLLDPTIRVEAGSAGPLVEPAHIFLTGATGFLGAFLLHELLKETRADIHCLVRSADAAEGKKKLQRALESCSLWDEDLGSRIVPVPGDLSQPLLGLSTEEFRRLASRVDVVYHSGALVHWIYPYEMLKATNVTGTQEVLRLASQAEPKPVHFISTLGVFPLLGNSDTKTFREEDTLDHRGVLYGGYAQSKWVAEKLVAAVRARGLRVSVYRPALITGHSLTGAWKTDGMCRMIKSWIELGAAPSMEMPIYMTPVDYVSKAIVHLSRQPESLGKVFHLANPIPVQFRELVAWIGSFGYQLRQIPYDTWRAGLMSLTRRFRGEDAVSSLLPLFSMSVADDALAVLRRMPGFDCQNALHGLAGTSVSCPRVDGHLFQTYLSQFVRSGLLRAPQQGRIPDDLSGAAAPAIP